MEVETLTSAPGGQRVGLRVTSEWLREAADQGLVEA
jgi:hypothetical protein